MATSSTSRLRVVSLLLVMVVATTSIAVSQPRESQVEAHYKRGLELFKRGDYRGARSAWEEAVAAYRQLGLERDAAVMLSNVGNASRNLGEYEQAEAQMGEALVILRKLEMFEDAAKTILNMGNLAHDMGQYLRAANYWERALATYRELGLERPAANALRNLGQLTRRTGEYGKGLGQLEEALAIYRKLSIEEEAASTIRIMGDLMAEAGEYGKAQNLYEQALSACRTHQFEKDAATALVRLGLLANRLGDYAKAQSYYEQALATYRRLDFNAGVALTLSHMIGLAYDSGDPGKAKMLYGKIRASFGGAGPDSQDAWCGYGDLELEEGQLDQALEVFSKNRCGPLRVGRAFLMAGSLPEAREQMQLAVVIGESTRNAEHLVAGLIGLAISEERLGDRKAAAEHYQKAVDAMEEQREGLGPNERQSFFSGRVFGFRRIEAYEGLVRVLLGLGKLEDAFYWAEAGKARWILESISRSGAGVMSGIDPGLRAKEGILAQQIEVARKRLDEAFQKGNRELQDRLEGELKARRGERQALVAQIRREHPEYASVQYPQPLRAAELALQPDEVLLAYEVTERKTVLFVVRGRRVQKTSEIAMNRRELSDLVQEYRRVFVEIGSTGSRAALAQLNVQAGYRLFVLLLKDALKDIKPDDKVLVVPDESLCLLPFEALVEAIPSGEIKWADRGHGPFPKGVKYVGDTRLFSYWQSASSLTVLRQLGKNVAGTNVLAVADPVFSAQDERLKHARPALTVAGSATEQMQFQREAVDAMVKHLGWELFPRLASTERFLDRIRDSHLRALVGLEARESSIKSERLDQYGRAVIFATHAIVDDRMPYLRQAALVLSNPELTGEDLVSCDGFLTMTEIMGLRMPTELAAALACETGLGSQVAGEGVMHLGRAFQYAGAKSVLMSLWGVEDESTNMLGERVLTGMKNGETKATALMAARRMLREQGYEHPFFWAGFILVGEHGEVPKRNAAQPVALWLSAGIIGGMVVAASSWFLRRCRLSRIKQQPEDET